MSLNPQYMIAPSVQEFFIDKFTGLPMAGGQVYFYSDVNRNILKPIYTLSGSPPNYSYVQLPNPVTLTGVGTFSDAQGNDVLPYYYPYDANGNIELYFIQVYNSQNTLQFTRQGYPNFTGGSVSNEDFTNYVPNGQFYAYNNITGTNNQVSAGVTAIAPGGWYYQIPNGSSSVDQITWPANLNYVSNPSGSPRYSVKINHVSGSDAFRYLTLRFSNVNTFAGDTLNFNFSALATGSAVPISLVLNQYYGGTGSSTGTTVTTAVPNSARSIGSSAFANYTIPITFPTNSTTAIGTNQDDYVDIDILLPLVTAFTVQFTDFVLTLSTNVIFPITTINDTSANAIAGNLPMPKHDGSNLYLPAVLGLEGLIYDSSSIGNIVAKTSLASFNGSVSTISNELLADGSQYLASGYSALGIPYARLGAYYMSAGASNIPQYGTGSNFATATIRNSSELFININEFGSGQIFTNDPGVTGFSFRQLTPGLASTTNVETGRYGANILYVQASSLSMADVSTSIVFGLYRSASSGSNPYTVYTVNATGVTVASMGGTYFTFTANSTNFYVWFKYNGSGSDPAPGGTGIQIDLYTGYGPADVCYLIFQALGGGPGVSIIPSIGSLVNQNSWFPFYTANGNKYYVWYSLNGNGTDPKPATYTMGIPVTYTSAQTAAQVATATQIAINSVYFAVPNFQGLFLRGYDPNGIWDLDYTSRFGINGTGGNQLGTFEYDQFLSHTHTFTVNSGTGGGLILNNGTTYNPEGGISNTGAAGGKESRPVNANVVWAVKY